MTNCGRFRRSWNKTVAWEVDPRAMPPWPAEWSSAAWLVFPSWTWQFRCNGPVSCRFFAAKTLADFPGDLGASACRFRHTAVHQCEFHRDLWSDPFTPESHFEERNWINILCSKGSTGHLLVCRPPGAVAAWNWRIPQIGLASFLILLQCEWRCFFSETYQRFRRRQNQSLSDNVV